MLRQDHMCYPGVCIEELHETAQQSITNLVVMDLDRNEWNRNHSNLIIISPT
jgi:hypothetical protein